MSRKDNSPGISFFSFQDIITSITGIMFLVVMMLVLMVLLSPSNAARQQARAVAGEIRELEKSLAELRQLLAALDSQSEAQRKRIEELGKLKLETLPDLKASLVRKLTAADEAMPRLRSETDRFLLLRKKESAAGVRLQEKTVACGIRRDALNAAITRLKKTVAENRKISERMKNMLRFVWDRRDSREPVLMVCGATEIAATTLTGSTGTQVFNDLDNCLDWCRKHDPDTTYFILLLKPGSFHYAEKFSGELKKAGFRRGREVLPDDKTTVFGEKVK